VTVVNEARGYDMARRHPVATLQLAGQSLLELDQIADTAALPQAIYRGMACVALEYSQGTGSISPAAGVFAGRSVSPHTGHAGEHYTILHPHPKP